MGGVARGHTPRVFCKKRRQTIENKGSSTGKRGQETKRGRKPLKTKLFLQEGRYAMKRVADFAVRVLVNASRFGQTGRAEDGW